MNMGGLGNRMMRGRMKSQRTESLEQMIDNALESGANLIACQMSMDVMGISKDELNEQVEIGGVANFLEHAENSGINMFVRVFFGEKGVIETDRFKCSD